MNKDFDGWNIMKKNIDINKRRPHYKERDIWWCSLGTNIGFEHNGDQIEKQRPILVIKGLGKGICLVVPLTSSLNIHKYRVPIGTVEDKDSSVVISQIKVIDTKRLDEKICVLDKEKFEITRKAIRDML